MRSVSLSLFLRKHSRLVSLTRDTLAQFQIRLKEKLISEQKKKKLISAVKSLDNMIRQCHSYMSMLTIVCTFPNTDDPLELFFFFLCLNCQEVRWRPGVSSLSDSGQPQVSQALL